MDTFNKKFIFAFSSEDSESNAENSLVRGINDSIDNNSNDGQHSLPTEFDISEPGKNPNQSIQNSNEVLSSNSSKDVGLITQNNKGEITALISSLTIPGNGSTKEKTYKKKGRREKNSTLTGGHTGHFPGNLLRKDGTAFMDSIYSCLNKRCKIYDPTLKLQKINFAEQFGFNEDNKRFIQQHLYKILRYENDNNQMVIEMMTNIFRDKIFMYIIGCTFEYLYGKYISEKNTIYFGEGDIHFNCFETLSKMAIKRDNKDKKNNKHWTQERLQLEKTLFIQSSKKFIKEVNGEGKFRKRKRRKNFTVLYQYEVVDEIENFLGSLKPYIY